MPSAPTFQLFTSLRYDPLLLSSTENSRQDLNFINPSPFYMLAYHRDRMVEAAQHFDFDHVTQKLADGKGLHEELLKRTGEWQQKEGKEDGPLKIRILFDKSANMTVDFLSIPAVPLITLYPTSFDPPNSTPQEHLAKKDFNSSPLTGDALILGITDSRPAGDSSQGTQPPQPKEFEPSSLTGPTNPLTASKEAVQSQNPGPFRPSPLTGGALELGSTDFLPAGNKSPSVPPPPPEWKLKLDTAPTSSSPYTLLKTTERETYDRSRERALPDNKESAVHREVVLWNEVKEVTEGTLTSLYFWRGGKWVTPPVGVPEAFITTSNPSKQRSQNSDEGELRKPFAGRWGHSVRSAKVGAGGQRGTSRRWALGKGFCMEETIDVATVQVEEGVWVSNGVRGFGYGRIIE